MITWQWGCWTATHELKHPSMRIVFPTIDRVKSALCGMLPSKRLLCFSEVCNVSFFHLLFLFMYLTGTYRYWLSIVCLIPDRLLQLDNIVVVCCKYTTKHTCHSLVASDMLECNFFIMISAENVGLSIVCSHTTYRFHNDRSETREDFFTKGNWIEWVLFFINDCEMHECWSCVVSKQVVGGLVQSLGSRRYDVSVVYLEHVVMDPIFQCFQIFFVLI